MAELLSIVLPFHNQADHAAAVTSRYAECLAKEGVAFELLTVPNACSDRTADALRELAAREPRVRVIESREGGWGHAVMQGLAAAKGDVLCYANSARTDPADIAPLLKLFEANAPCLAKARRMIRDVPIRQIGSMLFNLECRLLYGIRIRDVNGTPKMLSRELFESLSPFTATGDLIDLEIVSRVTRLGLRIVELPIYKWDRHGGISTTNFKSAFKMYFDAAALRSRL